MKIDSSIFNKRFMAFTALVLLLAELVLILLSWILFAIGEEEVRSLLSSEGIRWFVGGFTTMVSSPLLVWLIILLMAFGAFQKSGLISFTDASYQMTYRDKTALRVAIVFLLAYIVVILLLLLVCSGTFTACGAMAGGGEDITLATSYTAHDQDDPVSTDDGLCRLSGD